jgi:hypothetical protein
MHDGQSTTGYDTLRFKAMTLLVYILSTLFMLFGIGLFFSPARGSFIAGVVCIGSAAFAYDEKSLVPLAIGFGLLWVLRMLGFEQR